MSGPPEEKLDGTNSLLDRMLLDEIAPVVMVLRTQLVEEACQKNNLTLIQMLQPFSVFGNIDVPVRTVNDQPYRLRTFKLRLVYASDICQPNIEDSEKHLKKVVSDANEKALNDIQDDSPKLEMTVPMADPEYMSPWFRVFNKALLHTVSFSDHEAFDHPVACLIVVSTKDEQPINKFVDLFNTDQLPSLLNDGAMDPKILKYYLLIHDSQDGSSNRANELLAEMRSTFGPNDCRMLCINSYKEGDEQRNDNPWSRVADTSGGQDIGCFLNIDDVDEIKDLMLDLSSKHIIPYMEQKIRSLNQQVSTTRKGFRNQIKNLWWRKGKEDTADALNGPMYTFSSIESQIRVLGDYAFILRDYELSLSSYRLLSTDYKLDKAWRRYAGAQEMIGLSLFMLDQSGKEAEYYMENAFSTYLKMGSSGQRNATRCGLWWVEILKVKGQYKEAATVYFRISTEEPSLHAAVMFEQASYCYLRSTPPMLRKYGFHLILAGNRYNICDQRKHAVRAYRSALPVYKEQAWSYISDHVHFNIGRWYALLGMSNAAIQHMLEVLACNHQSPTTQEALLGDFLQIVQKLGKKYDALRLRLPVINVASLKVFFEDHRTFASSAAALVNEHVWRSLEEDLVPSVNPSGANWLYSLPKSSRKNNDSHICVAGEPIKVDLEFKNPLQIPIVVSCVRLICKFSPISSTGEYDLDCAQSVNDENGGRSDTGSCDAMEVSNRESNDDCSSFISSEVDFTLEGDETMMVQLKVSPKMEGILQIIGVRWTLSGSVVGYLYFDSHLAKKNCSKGRIAASKKTSKNKLKFTVIKSLPKLEARIHQLPLMAYSGDLQRIILEVSNHSDSSVKNMKLKISHPRFVVPGRLEDLDMEFPGCLEKHISHDIHDMQDNAMDKLKGLSSFPKDAGIQGGTTLLWPLWLHPVVPGNISLNMSIYYEMVTPSEHMNYRILRMRYDLEVLPSLDVSVQITPSPSKLQEFLVRMDIVNRSNSKNFQLRQVSSVGNSWHLSELLPTPLGDQQQDERTLKQETIYRSSSNCPRQLLAVGQGLSQFFKLMEVSKTSRLKGALERQSSLSLDISSISKSEIDVSSMPLSEFHIQEIWHQEKQSAQEQGRTVDLVLISQWEKTSPEPEQQSGSQQLFVHYLCHCSADMQSPIQWQMDGPRIVTHDFSDSFCEIGFQLTIRNSSDYIASVSINTSDDIPFPSQQSDPSQTSHVGWHDISLSNGGKVPSDIQGQRNTSTRTSVDSSLPFLWCASSSTKIKLEPMSSMVVPVRICVMAPGTYDLSNYTINWKLRFGTEENSVSGLLGRSWGTSPGHPFYLTVLQSS
ncbi:hypothetical protein AMTRI_Chr11g151670 [Amborella trichopoda]|uniref:Trafficking protein particle complex subunit 8 n=1 Tax=Amborella trichopoda TaxID=13333 RepID=U5D6K6_AMBTC|nr:trafficking protein particle complex subunit 8 [Amborella trichopoda]XP_020529335.1 trafficking protein particle complex subunit 8 [Amborella trichopoda]XP_020529336.1 trafficking protein particle complex subunit 8 [Amborella trichopoda]ERN15998.1 hypothetical protein AMTR_s00030p00037130 [Amborella trichopoda]|eukprot:XP_006854531.1 trafficking protein particle complex subunit 8 [Amborella trichopoda]